MPSDMTHLRSSIGASLKRLIDEPWTLDPRHYTSSDYYDLEVERIWKKEWICVGHIKEVPNVGDYFSIQFVNEPLVIVRGADAQIRALSTVCRHRLMLVAEPGACGNASSFVCPYHRWTYGLDGQLKSALHMERHRDFDPSGISLPEFRLEIWNDLIWINLDDDASPLAPRLVELEEAMAVYKGPEGGVMTALYDKTWRGNWKSQVENNLEGYHHMGMHQQSIELYSPTKNVTNLTHGECWTRHQVPYERGRDVTESLIAEADWSPDDWLAMEQPALDIINIHPGNSFSIYPGGAGYYSIWPLGVDSFRFRAHSIRPPGELRRFDPDGERYDSERVLDEDGVAMTHILNGAHSSKAEPGPLSWMEASLPLWQQWMAKRLA